MNEFGETPSFYIWPKNHTDGAPFPSDFYDYLVDLLDEHGYSMEPV